MVLNGLFLLVFVALTAVLIWAAVRAWRSRTWGRRLLAGIPLSLLALILLAVSIVTARGIYTLYLPHSYQPMQATIAHTPEQAARGEHIALTVCSGCHTTTGEPPLSGGFNLANDIGLPIGDLYPPNLTPSGEIAGWTDSQIFTFFRTGHKPDGRWTMMPVVNMGNLSDEDLYAVIAYLRTQEPEVNEVPPLRITLLGVILVGADIFKLPFEAKAATITAPPEGPTAQYGEYLIGYQDCRDCHGVNFDGVVSGPVPPGPALAHVEGWTVEQFITTMRTGTNPAGHELQPPMPWKQIGRMDDVELTAMYEYLVSFISTVNVNK